MARGRLTRRAFVGASLAVPAAAALPIGFRGAFAQEGIVVTMVTDTAGLGDQNFNDLSNAGGTRAAEEFGIEWRVIESVDAASYTPNLTAAAEQSALVVATGFLLAQAIDPIAAQFADKHFTIIDAVVEQPNVQSVLFKEQEAAFLCGVASGMLTQTSKIGIVGGQRIPPVIRYEVGYKAGIQAVNPDVEILVSYVDSFDDPVKGREFTLAQFNDGADIVFPVAGTTGIGCYEAVKELNNLGEQWVIGADVTQDHLAPGFELMVCRKGVDEASYNACRQEVEGTFETGMFNLGIAEGGVAFEDPNDRVPEDVESLVRLYEAMILDGSLVPPTTDEEFDAFEAPATPEATPAA